MKGKVIGTERNDMLKVEIVRMEACGHCKGCLSAYMESDMELDVKNLCDAEVGDWVELELQDNAFLHAMLVSYGVPLVSFVSGILIGEYAVAPMIPALGDGMASCMTGILAVLGAYGWIRSQNDRWETGKYTPLAISLAPEGYQENEA